MRRKTITLLAAAAAVFLLFASCCPGEPELRPDARLAAPGRWLGQRFARRRRGNRAGALRQRPRALPTARLEHEALHHRRGPLQARARIPDLDQGLPRRAGRRQGRPPRQPLPAGRRRPRPRHAGLLQRLLRRPRHQRLRPRRPRSRQRGSNRSPAGSTPTTRSSTAVAASPTPATRPAPTSAPSPASPSTRASRAQPAPAVFPPTRPSWRRRSWPARWAASCRRRPPCARPRRTPSGSP